MMILMCDLVFVLKNASVQDVWTSCVVGKILFDSLFPSTDNSTVLVLQFVRANSSYKCVAVFFNHGLQIKSKGAIGAKVAVH